MSIFKHALAALGGVYCLLLGGPALYAGSSTPAVERLLLQRQQQQDALSLSLRQNMGSVQVPKLDIHQQQQQLERLQLQQRQLLQQLEQQQLQQDLHLQQSLKAQSAATGAAQRQIEQQRFAQERQMQLQRFDREQQQLLQSLKK